MNADVVEISSGCIRCLQGNSQLRGISRYVNHSLISLPSFYKIAGCSQCQRGTASPLFKPYDDMVARIPFAKTVAFFFYPAAYDHFFTGQWRKGRQNDTG